MSKPRVYCTQCANYHGYGKAFSLRDRTTQKIHRCHRGGRQINFVTGVNLPYYGDCAIKDLNKWGHCPYWKPNLALRILMWRPKWLRTVE